MREVLNAQRMLLSQSKTFLHPTQRLIRVGTSPLINSALLGVLLEPFRRTHPDVKIVLREMNLADLYRMLDGGLLDYVLGVVDAHKTRWRATPLYEEPLLFIPPTASIDDMIRFSIDAARKAGHVRAGDLVVVTGGAPLHVAGTTNFLKVEKV